MKILLITKTSKNCKTIQDYVRRKISKNDELLILEGEFGDKKPDFSSWDGDCVISFLSPWILPELLLEKSNLAINFHPAPPAYPGIGCYNFAIYNQDKEFGVTCHYMNRKVDSGKIIKVVRFSISNSENIFSLKTKTMMMLEKLFYEIFDLIINKKVLPVSNEFWSREPYTRKDLQDLCKLDLNMSEEEMNLILRATYFSGAKDQPFIEFNKKKFIYTP